MKKVLPVVYLFLAWAGLVCCVVCGIQFVMALRYGELGRVVMYFLLAVLSVELLCVSVTRLVRMRRTKQEQS